MVESSTYAFRWDYSTQADYDKSVTAKTKKNRGVFTYVTILAVTFMLSVSLVIASVIIGNSIQKSNLGFVEHTPMEYDGAIALDELY